MALLSESLQKYFTAVYKKIVHTFVINIVNVLKELLVLVDLRNKETTGVHSNVMDGYNVAFQ